MAFSILSKIKNQKLKNSINSIIQNASDFHKNPFLYSFTDHGINHSNRMLQCIDRLLESCNKKRLLNEYECYVLVAAIYLHDIGIQQSKIDLLIEFAKEYKISFDKECDIPAFVRNNHHLISSFLIKKDIKKDSVPLVFDGDSDLGKYISLVVESHGIDFSNKDDSYKTYVYHDSSVRVKLLSILLCLADSFDCDNRRIDSKKFKYVELPPISRIHWIKHLYVNGIVFHNRVITISYLFPDLNSGQRKIYQSFFCNETEYWINDIKDKYLSILNDVDLVFEVNREIDYESYVDVLDLDDYSYIEESVFDRIVNGNTSTEYKKVSIGILKKDSNVLMVQRKKPEISNSCNSNSILEWQFPAGSIKTIDSPEEAIIREVLEETGICCTVNKILGKRLHPDTETLCYYFALNYVSGDIKNGDTNENKTVSWIPIDKYQSKITSSINWKVQKYLKER